MTTLHQEEAPVASEMPVPSTAKAPKPSWYWLARVLCFVPYLGLLVAAICAVIDKPRRKRWLFKLVPAAIMSLFLLGLVMLGHTNNHSGFNNPPSAQAPVQRSASAPVAAGNPAHPIPVAAPASTTGLQLPAESSTDEAYAVANEMMAIFNKAIATGNPAYLDHYYASHSVQGYTVWAARVAKGPSQLRFYMATGPNYPTSFQSNSDGSITVSYYEGIKNPLSSPTITSLTFSWHSDVQEWRYDSSPSAAG